MRGRRELLPPRGSSRRAGEGGQAPSVWGETPSGASRHLPLAALCAGGGTVLSLALTACAAPVDPEPTYLALDCAKPFEAQVATLTAQPDLTPAGVVGAEPYLYYSAADGRTSYLITRPGSPAHPAIMMQKAKGSDVVTTGCPYGSRKGYDQLKAYLDSLKTWTRKT